MCVSICELPKKLNSIESECVRSEFYTKLCETMQNAPLLKHQIVTQNSQPVFYSHKAVMEYKHGGKKPSNSFKNFSKLLIKLFNIIANNTIWQSILRTCVISCK